MSRENILKHLYILYDPGDGLDYFDTEEAALQHARSISIEYLDGDGWSEDVEGIYVAKVIHHGRLRNTGEFFEFEMVPCRDKASADIATLESLRTANAELLAALVSFRNLARLAAERWDADEDARVGKLLLAMSGFRPGYRADIDAIHETITKAKGTE